MLVLVTGATGYLGQFVAAELAAKDKVVATWLSTNPGTSAAENIKYVQCDLTDPASVGLLFSQHTFDAVVNTAALSQPAACEANAAAARALNVPQPLLAALHQQKEQTGTEATLLHISTDQVYDGSRKFWTEESETAPVNEYGRSKLLSEQAITNEYRSPILVHDLARVVAHLLHEADASTLGTFNTGGPERLSRADMAQAIAAHCGIDPARVDVAESAAVKRAAPSPLDISMDSSKLQKQLPFQLRAFAAALEDVFPTDRQAQQDASTG